MRILSYNIQAAVNSHSYLHYALQFHRHILPSRKKQETLHQIADFIAQFDVVCLQEVDLGGLRNGFANHATQLQILTGLPYLLSQVNRRVGRLSLHGNLILSRYPLTEVLNAPLPARIAGRGVLAARLNGDFGELVIANTHLSLGKLDQHKQLRFIRTQLHDYSDVLLVGDLNCQSEGKPLRILSEHGYHHLGSHQPTFPSWKPTKTFDHAFLKGHFDARCWVEPFHASDHLPIAIEICS